MARLTLSHTTSKYAFTLLTSAALIACSDSSLNKVGQPSNLDANAEQPKKKAVAGGPLSVAHTNDRLGTPTFAWGSMAPRPDLAKLTHAQAAETYLRESAGTFQLADGDKSFALKAVHDTGKGAVIAAFERRVDGIAVFRDELKVAMTRDHRLVSISGQVSTRPSSLQGGRYEFKNAPEATLSFAVSDAGADVRLQAIDWQATEQQGEYQWFVAANLPAARVKKVWFPLGTTLVPAHYAELELPDVDTASTQAFAYVVSANDGRLLMRLNQTADATYRVYAEQDGYPLDGVFTDFSPHPTGKNDGSRPAGWAPSTLVSINHLPTVPETDVWLPAGSQTTVGNNVFAYADLAQPDGFGAGDLLAVATSADTFDYTFDPDQAHNANQTQHFAAITQLFFTNNFLHDWYYDAGFDEASGNAQAQNFGRGGVEADPINAEAHDFGGVNNANMSTPADGKRPRMQMYAFTLPSTRAATFTPAGQAPITPAFLGDAAWGADYNVTGLLKAGIDADGNPEGCKGPLVDLTGHVALIRRGGTSTVSTCSFQVKAQNAQAAGAVAVIIYNNQATNLASMAGTGISIPGAFLDKVTGDQLAGLLGAGTQVTAQLSRTGRPTRDGTLDNQIVAHEWGHYISNRLIANAAGLGGTHQRGMGEGWADFHALLLSVKEGDDLLPNNENWAGAYPMANYAIGDTTTQYHGIRRVPYSTDFAIDPLTFIDIVQGQPLPPLAPEHNYFYTGDNAEVHAIGEIWASMLWECYAALLRGNAPTPTERNAATFADKRELMKAYLVAAYKLTPPMPTMLEARDALLAAARANSEEDFLTFAGAFARRGAGLRAVAPDRFTTTNAGVEESYATGNDVFFVRASLTEKTVVCAAQQDGVLDSGETGTLKVTIRNTGYGLLPAPVVMIGSNLQGELKAPAKVEFPPLEPFAEATQEVEVSLKGLSDITNLEVTFSAFDDTMSLPPAEGVLQAQVNYDVVPSDALVDDVEAPISAFTPKRDPSLAAASFTREEVGGSGYGWFGVDAPVTSDLYLVSPVFNVDATAPFTLSFDHWFDFEFAPATPQAPAQYFDGGVVEVSTDGITWVDANTLASVPYNGTLLANGSDNPLAGREAFVARSTGAPAFVRTTLDFGSSFHGSSVVFRFRVGSDQGAAATGWAIDNIEVTGVTNKPFTKIVPDRQQCVNHPPVASAGLPSTVDEGATVTLDGSQSRDLDGAALTYVWRQVDGPAVALADAGLATPSFVAPEVDALTTLTFSLVVSDGLLSSAAATVSITVNDRTPGTPLPSERTIDERATLTLDAGSWEQVSGPEGTLSATGFTAPDVSADARVVLRSGGRTLDVLVRNVNRAPLAKAKSLAEALHGALVVLDARKSEDADGDTLSFEWTQVSGPKVQLVNPRGAQASFVAPKLVDDAELTFQVVALDAQAASTPVKTTVLVKAATASAVAPQAETTTSTPTKAGCSATGARDVSWAAFALLALSRLRRRR